MIKIFSGKVCIWAPGAFDYFSDRRYGIGAGLLLLFQWETGLAWPLLQQSLYQTNWSRLVHNELVVLSIQIVGYSFSIMQDICQITRNFFSYGDIYVIALKAPIRPVEQSQRLWYSDTLKIKTSKHYYFNYLQTTTA